MHRMWDIENRLQCGTQGDQVFLFELLLINESNGTKVLQLYTVRKYCVVNLTFITYWKIGTLKNADVFELKNIAPVPMSL